MAHPELLKELRARRDAGEPPEKIYEALQRQGWSAEDITGGLALISLHATHFNVGEQLSEMEAQQRARVARRNELLMRLLLIVLFAGAGCIAVRTFGIPAKISELVNTFSPQPAIHATDTDPVLINDYGVYGNYPTSTPGQQQSTPRARATQPAVRPIQTGSAQPAHTAPTQPTKPVQPAQPAPSQQPVGTYVPQPDGPPIYIPD